MFVLFNVIITLLVSAGNALYARNIEADTWGTIYGFAVLIPFIVGVRRMHDVGKSGWYLLIPLYNLILVCTDGDSGDNEYGSNPKAVEAKEFLDLANSTT